MLATDVSEEHVQIPKEAWTDLSNELLRICKPRSSRSRKPAIYGAAAIQEVKQLRPLKTSIEVSLPSAFVHLNVTCPGNVVHLRGHTSWQKQETICFRRVAGF